MRRISSRSARLSPTLAAWNQMSSPSGAVLAGLPPTFGDAVGVLLARLQPLLQLAIGVGQPATTGPGQVEAERQRVSHRFLAPRAIREGRNPCRSRGAAYGTAARGQAAPGARGKGNRTDFVNAMALGQGQANRGESPRFQVRNVTDDVSGKPDLALGRPAAGLGDGERVGHGVRTRRLPDDRRCAGAADFIGSAPSL
jgi:hypothetical protein